MNYFFIDAETDGLYGRFLSVAILVTNNFGEEIDRFYGSVTVTKSDIESEWVKTNVFPHLKNAECFFKNENELLESVWKFWMKHRESVYVISDIMHPVESRLFTECVQNDIQRREFLAPFPLVDLSSVLIAKGVDWNISRQGLSGINVDSHDAMNDVKMIKKIWFDLQIDN